MEGPPGLIHIKIMTKGKWLTCLSKDDGRGKDKRAEGTLTKKNPKRLIVFLSYYR
jgi:hypothetical protein